MLPYLFKTNLRHKLVLYLTTLIIPVYSLKAKTTASSDEELKACMRKATAFMMDKVSIRGGFVGSYLPDFSRRWGELEAYPSMIWIDGPTPAMGNALLDAYLATEDEYYYQQACRVADALTAAQLHCGGWNYNFDFAGEESHKQWYATIGKNAWGVSEYNHFYGNATFDDQTSYRPANFFLRIYLLKKDPIHKQALDRAIDFFLQSQYPNGGWPQRYPLRYDFPAKDGSPDYSSFITLNDGVMEKNIEFMLRCYYLLDDERCLRAAEKGLDCLLLLQQAAPTAGWALQYNLQLQPAKARDFEPASVCVSTTYGTVMLLMEYYRLTGEKKFMQGIPAALSFLDEVAFNDSMLQLIGNYDNRGRLCPRMVVPGSFTPLFLHRKGSHIVNGDYYVDQNPLNTIGHYSSFCTVNTDFLRNRYETLMSLPAEELSQDSPLLHPELREALLKQFIYNKRPEGARKFLNPVQTNTTVRIQEIIASLNEEGYWPAPLVLTTNPYIGEGCVDDPVPELYEETLKHPFNTQFYRSEDPPIGISVNTYIQNMGILLKYLLNQNENSNEK
ncbi:MAG: pectate lyase [Bacteroidales bacterium]|nr:pectate lyase [Bacteroidales bacterium]